jgi:transcriptional regulator with XRE-family HTH domain
MKDKIRLLREAKGLSQEHVADKLGISQTAYSNIERGETQPRLPRLQQLAEILGVDMQEIMRSDSHITLNIENNNNGEHAVGVNVQAENKELLLKLLEAKDKHIAMLEDMLAQCREGKR